MRRLFFYWALIIMLLMATSQARAAPHTCAELFNDCISDDFGQLQQCYGTLSKVFGAQLDGICLPPRTNEQNAEMFQHWAYQNKLTKSDQPALDCAVQAFTDSYPCHPKFNPAVGY